MQTVLLNNGVIMPAEGFGVFQVAPHKCESVVLKALEAGCRMIDTAQAYYNEEGVGRAIARSGIARDKLFIVDKVWISNAGEGKTAASIDASLRKLGTDYIDLLLIHQPFGDYYGAWRDMQKALEAGKVRAIGLSNFYDVRFVDLCENMPVKPAVVQLETHVFSQQKTMRHLAKPYGTQVMAWAPLAQGQFGIFENETLLKIAARHGKTVAQVALRYLIEEGIIVIPKSVHPERMQENLVDDGFDLTESERLEISALDKGHPAFADFNNPDLARFLLGYDPKFNPENKN